MQAESFTKDAAALDGAGGRETATLSMNQARHDAARAFMFGGSGNADGADTDKSSAPAKASLLSMDSYPWLA